MAYDPAAPDLLDPAMRVPFKWAPPPPVVQAIEHWEDREIWDGRRRGHLELRLRRCRNRYGAIVVLPPEDMERLPHGDFRAILHRALIAIAERSDARTRPDQTVWLVGKWVNGQFFRFLSAQEWADIVGCSVGQWHQVINRLKAAGYIGRRQRRDLDRQGRRRKGRVASLVVTARFWQESGAWQAIQSERRKAAKEEREKRQTEEPPRQHPPRAAEPPDVERERCPQSWPTKPPPP